MVLGDVQESHKRRIGKKEGDCQHVKIDVKYMFLKWDAKISTLTSSSWVLRVQITSSSLLCATTYERSKKNLIKLQHIHSCMYLLNTQHIIQFKMKKRSFPISTKTWDPSFNSRFQQWWRSSNINSTTSMHYSHKYT